MTTLEHSSIVNNGRTSWARTWLRIKNGFRDGVVTASLTFLGGVVTSAVLQQPVDTYVIPKVLEYIGHYQTLNLYQQKADGQLLLNSCYKLVVPPWSHELSGRMVEIVDQKACPGTATNASSPTPVQFKITGAWNGGVMSGAFRHLDSAEFGGGAFSADNVRGSGIYVGAMSAQDHEPGERCKLTHFWVAVGEPDRANAFPGEVEKAIRGADGRLALLPNPAAASGSCKMAGADAPK